MIGKRRNAALPVNLLSRGLQIPLDSLYTVNRRSDTYLIHECDTALSDGIPSFREWQQ